MSYSMEDTLNVARQAARDIERWLRGQQETIEVQNVEGSAEYRREDVDLLWTVGYPAADERVLKVEVKGDRLHKTGNFFFETVSNKGKGTPGCFMYTAADYIFYYFVVPQTLHILPTLATRAWFIENLDRFAKRETTTPVGGGRRYVTVGRLVPIVNVHAEVPGTCVVDIGEGDTTGDAS